MALKTKKRNKKNRTLRLEISGAFFFAKIQVNFGIKLVDVKIRSTHKRAYILPMHEVRIANALVDELKNAQAPESNS